jgi:hypothetical protein
MAGSFPTSPADQSLWRISSGKITAMYADWATIEIDGVQHIVHRRPPPANFVRPWRRREFGRHVQSGTRRENPRQSHSLRKRNAHWRASYWLAPSFAVLSATNRRETDDFVVARLAWPARSPSGRRTERAYLRVATPISIWLNAQRDRRSARWIAIQLGSSSSAPPRRRTRGRRMAALPPCQLTAYLAHPLPDVRHRLPKLGDRHRIGAARLGEISV